MTPHQEKVAALALSSQNHNCLKHSKSKTLRNGYYKKECTLIDLNSFNKILKVEKGFVDVEPKVTMRTLVDKLFPLIPPVVPEFPTITVGGAVMGAALESSSFKFGQFNDCCLEYDLLINGKLYTVSREKDPDLFWGVSGSYGTLGILTRVRLSLIKAKKAVRLKIIEADPFPYFSNPPDCDFLDAVRFKEQTFVILGFWSDEKPTQKLRSYSPWFYQQLESKECVLSTKDYLFRFDRGAFWMGRYLLSKKMVRHALLRESPQKTVAAIDREPGPLFRHLLGWACSSSTLYRALHTIPQEMIEESFFIHDFYTPPEQVETFLSCNTIYPIWLCPVKGSHKPQFLSPHYGRDSWVNVGLYGAYQDSLDEWHASLGGRKMLYSSTTLERVVFEKIYHENRYQELRKKFSAEKNFPHLYDKVKWNQKSILRKTTTSAII